MKTPPALCRAAVSDGSGALSTSGSTGQDLSQQNTLSGQKGNGENSSTGFDLASKFAAQFSDQVVSTANSYRSKDLSIQVTSHQMGSGKETITYYIADVYTSNINCFRTYFAQYTYGA